MSLGTWRHNYPPNLQAECPHPLRRVDPRARGVPRPRKPSLTQTWLYASDTLLIGLVARRRERRSEEPSCRASGFVHPLPNKFFPLHDDLVRTGALDAHPRRGLAIGQWRASEDL